ncbi:protein TsetseEP-like [Alligator mississippiensis]|uniref:protein TsetseEP-like n=1 Tax=Alligator mississippiensis TaxID=8496 RepID=UPI0028776F7D|nr:protein TsetseEP-like [Alligator mississippiensis]
MTGVPAPNKLLYLGQSGDQPKDQPGDQPELEHQEQPGDLPKDQPGNQHEDQPGDQPRVQPGEQPEGKPGELPRDQPGDQPVVQPEDEAEDLPENQLRDLSEDHAEDQPGDVPKDEPGDLPQDQPGDVPKDKPDDLREDQPGDLPQEKHIGDARVIRSLMPNSKGCVYKSILVTCQDRTTDVIEKIFTKYDVDLIEVDNFELVQVISEHKELVFPQGANVFYGMNSQCSADLILRRKPCLIFGPWPDEHKKRRRLPRLFRGGRSRRRRLGF